MNDLEIRDKIKMGVKSPSIEFTDKIMSEITSIQNEVPFGNKWITRILLFACCLIFILSVFVRLPNIEFFQYSIGFSPVVMPVVTIIFIFIVLQQLYDLRTSILNINRHKAVAG